MKNHHIRSDQYRPRTIAMTGEGGLNLLRKIFTTLSALTLLLTALLASSLLLNGCNSANGEPSAQVVKGTAAVGTPLSGQVTLKDSSATTESKRTVIGPDGTFAFDVTNMKAPFILQADGRANGSSYRLNSFAEKAGIANVNPLTDILVASAADGEDANDIFIHPDTVKLEKIRQRIDTSTADLMEKLGPLARIFSAGGKDPIKDRFVADHHGFDGLFDYVNITVVDGMLTITNRATGALVFSGSIIDLKGGHFTENNDDLPHPAALPDAPDDFEAKGGSGQVTLTWESVSNATTYNLYYSDRPGVTIENATKIADVSPPYIQSGLNSGSTLYYVVTAANSAGESEISKQAYASTDATQPLPRLPAKPTGVFATGGTRQVTLTWRAVSDATSYNVYYSASSTGVTKANGILIANVSSPAVFGDLTAGITYFYIVTAVNSAGESLSSVQVAATTLTDTATPTIPAPPGGISASGGAEQATVSWSAVSDAASYNLYWSTSPTVTKTDGSRVSGISSPYTKTGLSAGTTYYFIVTAVNSAGESLSSATTFASTDAPTPSVPNAPSAVTPTGGDKQVTLSWAAVAAATSYNIYWSTTPGVTTTNPRISTTTTTYVQTGLAVSTTYYYIVTAVNAAGQSVASPQVSANTNGAPLVCGSCHTIPPPSGEHAYHVTTRKYGCDRCHGSGYSATTVVSGTHDNGTVNLANSISGWTATTSTCANSCHGNRVW